MFELTQTAELSHWTGDAGDRAWRAFLGDVQAFVGRELPSPAASLPEASPPTAAKPGEHGGAPSLAVLPFTNRSGLPEDEVFAIGMVEDVIDALSQGANVRALSSSATARFAAGATPEIATLGQQLGVRYLLEGNVRRVGESLRVTAQLVDAASAEILWTQKFDRPLTELAGMQEELVSEVAANLGSSVLRLEMARALKKPGNLTAWECVTRAEAAFRQFNAESFSRAREEAEQAVAIAPDYGLAHAMLAMTTSLIAWLQGRIDADEKRQIATHIDRALALEPDNAAVLTWVGHAQNYLGQPQAGLKSASRAIELSPNHGVAYYACGNSCLLLDRVVEALSHFDSFLRLDPHSHLAYTGTYLKGRAHLSRGDWQSADAAFARSLAHNDNVAVTQCQAAITASHLGRTGEAQERMAKARQFDPAAALIDWERRLSLWYSASPARDEVVAHLRTLWTESEGGA
jgi:TolB-like protein/Tfp pilus assembly protein PilF